jgi:hypothetical protein
MGPIQRLMIWKADIVGIVADGQDYVRKSDGTATVSSGIEPSRVLAYRIVLEQVGTR